MYLSQPGFPGNEPYRPRRYRSLYYQCTTTTPAAAIGKMHNVSENFQQKRPVFRPEATAAASVGTVNRIFQGAGGGSPLFLWKQHERDRYPGPATARAKPHADARTPRRAWWSPCPPPAGGGTPRRAREAKPRPAEGRRPPSRREGRRGPPRGGPAAPGRQGGGGRRGTRGSTGRSAHQAKAPTARAEPRRTASRPRGGGGATPGHATATPRPDPTGGPGRGRAIANPRRGPPMRPTF